MINDGIAKKINIFCLLAAIIAVLLLPLKKEIWYDETISILCSKGINHDTNSTFENAATISSATLEQLNTNSNVFTATVLDNSNSFVYNISLHWFTQAFGNTLLAYVLFSKLCAIGLLISFYFLSRLLFKDNIFSAVAMLLFAVDNNMIGMSHEIRAYSMGAFFITAAGIHFYKFMYEREDAANLFLLGLFSVAAVLCHFLSAYVVLAFFVALVFKKRLALLSVKNILAMTVPVALITLFFYCSYKGLQVMNKQNTRIQQNTHDFNITEMIVRALKFSAINFKAVLPAFSGSKSVICLSFAGVITLYIAAARNAVASVQKRNLHLFFVLGISGSVFLSALCIKSHHYTALYHRYFSFCIPYCSLFTAYALYVLYFSPKVNKVIKNGAIAAVLLPSVALFALSIYSSKTKVRYNHISIANDIIKNHVQKMDVPEWNDAFLVQAVLPAGYNIQYTRDTTTPYATLYKTTGAEKILVIKNDKN